MEEFFYAVLCCFIKGEMCRMVFAVKWTICLGIREINKSYKIIYHPCSTFNANPIFFNAFATIESSGNQRFINERVTSETYGSIQQFIFFFNLNQLFLLTVTR